MSLPLMRPCRADQAEDCPRLAKMFITLSQAHPGSLNHVSWCLGHPREPAARRRRVLRLHPLPLQDQPARGTAARGREAACRHRRGGDARVARGAPGAWDPRGEDLPAHPPRLAPRRVAGTGGRDILRERCALAGVEGSFSAHSLRAGFVTEAGRQNMPLPETMAMTGHRSVATVVRYFRAESPLGSKLGRMLD